MSDIGSEEEEVKVVIPPKPCTPELIKEHLSRVGKTFDGNSHAFTTLNLSNQALNTLSEEIGGYVHLRNIDLSGNQLPSVNLLSTIPYILTLNISGSSLTDLAVFNNSKAFTYVQNLNLSDNQITSLTPLKLPKLLHLNLQGNQISDISEFEGLPCVKTLDLRKNQLTGLNGLKDMPALEKVYLQKNNITSFVGIENVPKLTALKLKGNKIEVLEDETELPEMPSLEKLSLQENAFKDIKELKKLEFYTTLNNLDVTDNPMGEEISDAMKKEVLIILPNLGMVNKEVVEEEDREEAVAEAEEREKAAEEARLEAERLAKEAEEAEQEKGSGAEED